MNLVYSDGTVIKATRGRPKKVLPNGATLVDKNAPVKGKRGRKPIPVTEEVGKKGIYYIYSGVEYPREAILSGAGAPPRIWEGKTLERTIKRTPSKEEEIKEEGETLSDKGWVVGDNVRYIGSSKVGTVEIVHEDYLSVSFPGDRFLNPMLPSKVERVYRS